MLQNQELQVKFLIKTPRPVVAFLFIYVFIFNVLFIFWGGAECEQGRGRERESQNLKQAPGSDVSTRSSKSRTVRSDLS